MELYTGQDQPDHPSYKSREDRKRTFWTDVEDDELAKLVETREKVDIWEAFLHRFAALL